MTLANNVKILKAWSSVDFIIPAETESALEFDILIREAAKKFILRRTTKKNEKSAKKG